MKNRVFISKIAFGFLVVSSLCSMQAQQELAVVEEASIEPEYAPALLSVGQVTDLKNRFTFWLGKHYRCLYGGRCTKAEKKQVMDEWKRWVKLLGIGVVLYVANRFGVPMAKAAREEVMGLGEEFGKRVGGKIADEVKAVIADATQQIDTLINTQRAQLLGEGGDVAKQLKELERIRTKSLKEAEDTVKRLFAEGKTISEQTTQQIVKGVLDKIAGITIALPFGREARVVVPGVGRPGKEEETEKATEGEMPAVQTEGLFGEDIESMD